MSDDARRYVGFFEVRDFFRSQFEREGPDRFFQVRNSRSSDDRRGEGFLLVKHVRFLFVQTLFRGITKNQT